MDLARSLPAAVIFDMDGVLVDSNPFHLQKWIDMLTEHGVDFNSDEIAKQVLGYRNDATLRRFFGKQVSEGEILRLSDELEAKFREAFRPHARPLPGIAALLAECRGAGIPVALASSATVRNVEFIVDALGFRPYFCCLLSGDEVSQPKPHPEIYLEAAKRLQLAPESCVAFEDSFAGVEAAKLAQMKCVAVASTFPFEELQARAHADLVIHRFAGLTLDDLRGLFSDSR